MSYYYIGRYQTYLSIFIYTFTSIIQYIFMYIYNYIYTYLTMCVYGNVKSLFRQPHQEGVLKTQLTPSKDSPRPS